MRVKRMGRSASGGRAFRLGSSTSISKSRTNKNKKGSVLNKRKKGGSRQTRSSDPSPGGSRSERANCRNRVVDVTLSDEDVSDPQSESPQRANTSFSMLSSPGNQLSCARDEPRYTAISPRKLTVLRSSSRRFKKHCESPTSSYGATARKMPPQMSTNTTGDPTEIWDLMCAKSRRYIRTASWNEAHPALFPSMRTVLFDWMMDVCEAERLHRETLYLAMEYMDRFLSNATNVPSSKLQLFGSAAMHIACKFEEVYPPKLGILVSYTDGACDYNQVKDAERIMLTKLEWLLNPMTAMHWLGVYLLLLGQVGGESEADAVRTPHILYHLLHDSSYCFNTVMRSTFISMAQVLDLCMLDSRSVPFDYAVLAAAVFWCFFEPDHLVEQITGFRMEQLYSACALVEPYAHVCERRRAPGAPLPVFDGVDASEVHNIQTHVADLDTWMREAEERRAEMHRDDVIPLAEVHNS